MPGEGNEPELELHTASVIEGPEDPEEEAPDTEEGDDTEEEDAPEEADPDTGGEDG